jgi:hypothetical protein
MHGGKTFGFFAASISQVIARHADVININIETILRD